MNNKLLITLIIGILVIVSFTIGFNLSHILNNDQDDINKNITENITISNITDNITIVDDIEETIEEPDIEEEPEEKKSEELDELTIGDMNISEEYSDRDLDLFDDEVEFDGEDYDAEEIYTVSDVYLEANRKDFDGDIFLIVESEAIYYSFTFESDLNTSLIDDDETLSFNLLGESVEVIEWDNEEITFTKGNEYLIEEGDAIEYDGKNITLSMVTDHSVFVTVDSQAEVIGENKIKEVNDIEIKVSDVLYSSKDSIKSKALITISDNVEFEISDGEEYEDDSIWEWVIDRNSIGLKLIEEFKDLDEDFEPLSSGDSICLPNDYICMTFEGMDKDSSEEYNFDNKNENITKISGEFIYGHEDTDNILAYANGSFYDDENDKFILDTIELTDSDITMTNSTDSILLINDNEDIELEIAFNVSSVQVNGDSVSDEDDYLSNYGIIIKDTEDIAEDLELSISVPSERLEGSILIS